MMMMLTAVAIFALTQYPVGSAPARLTDATFAEVKQHVALRKNDLMFQSIDWKTSVFEGINAGRAEDKPILMWLFFGDPRGHC